MKKGLIMNANEQTEKGVALRISTTMTEREAQVKRLSIKARIYSMRAVLETSKRMKRKAQNCLNELQSLSEQSIN